MKAIVDSLIRLDIDQLPMKALAIIHRELTIPNPEYVKRSVFGRYTGSIAENIPLYRERQGRLLLPRGAHQIVRRAAEACSQTVTWDDRRATGEPLNISLVGLTLRDYQDDAAKQLTRRVQGCVVLPCGGGKTVIGCAAIAAVKRPCLILVHTQDLLEQWRESLDRFLGTTAGICTGGNWTPRHITVATVQTALKRLDDLKAIERQWGAVIVDEAHHVPAATFREVLSVLSARYRWGLTATPKREDGLTKLLELGIGPVVYEVGHGELVERGHLMLPKVEKFDVASFSNADDYHGLMEDIVSDPQRNRFICNVACELVEKEDRSTLILTGRVGHAQKLSEGLRRIGIEAKALTGKTPKKQRPEILASFREGSTQVLCATSLADEGLDISRLEAVIQATPSRSQGRTIQRLGRLMRPHPGKSTPVLIDLVDDHPIAMRQWKARKTAYRKVLGRHAV